VETGSREENASKQKTRCELSGGCPSGLNRGS
jgi:hypothetical protein